MFVLRMQIKRIFNNFFSLRGLCPVYDTKLYLMVGSSYGDMGTMGSLEYSFIAIIPKSTLTLCGRVPFTAQIHLFKN